MEVRKRGEYGVSAKIFALKLLSDASSSTHSSTTHGAGRSHHVIKFQCLNAPLAIRTLNVLYLEFIIHVYVSCSLLWACPCLLANIHTLILAMKYHTWDMGSLLPLMPMEYLCPTCNKVSGCMCLWLAVHFSLLVAISGAPPMDMPPVVPSMEADHPDLYIPKPVEEFLPRFRRYVSEKVGGLATVLSSISLASLYRMCRRF